MSESIPPRPPHLTINLLDLYNRALTKYQSKAAIGLCTCIGLALTDIWNNSNFSHEFDSQEYNALESRIILHTFNLLNEHNLTYKKQYTPWFWWPPNDHTARLRALTFLISHHSSPTTSPLFITSFP